MGVVESDGDRGLQVEESQETGHLIGLGSGYVVDNGAVLNGSNEAFFLVHDSFLFSYYGITLLRYSGNHLIIV